MGLALVVYVGGITGGFVWDDNNYVGDNIQLRSIGGLWRIWTQLGAVAQYYPMVFTSFWMEYHVWGLWTPGYHIVNILLHGCNAALLYCLVRKIKPGLALAVALLFVVHPVMVESVEWITERKNTLSMFFFLGSLLALYPITLPRPNKGLSSRMLLNLSYRRIAVGFVFFICAMLSKTTACSLPAVILVLSWYNVGSGWIKRILPMTPFFIVAVALVSITVYMERVVVGTTEGGVTLAPLERIIVAGHALWFYAGKLVWPWPTIFVYPRWVLDARDPLQYAWAVAALMVLVGVWVWRCRLGRGPAAALFIFVGTLTPALGFVNVYPFKFSFVADHFQYLAAPAFLTLICAGLFSLKQRLHISQTAARGCFAVLLICFGLLAARQARAYQSAESLYRDTIAKNPDASMPHNNLGEILAAKGKLSDAEQQYRAAIKAEPDFAGAYYNLGEILLRTGRQEEGKAHIEKALSLSPKNARLFFHAGLAYVRNNEADTATVYFKEAIRLKPNYVDPVIELGIVYGRTGHPDLALTTFQQALTLKPDSAIAWANMANAQAGMGRITEAIIAYQRALELDPAAPQTWMNYARALQSEGRTEESAAARSRGEALMGKR